MTDFALESVIRENVGFVTEGLRKRTFRQRGPLDPNLGAGGHHNTLAKVVLISTRSELGLLTTDRALHARLTA